MTISMFSMWFIIRLMQCYLDILVYGSSMSINPFSMCMHACTWAGHIIYMSYTLMTSYQSVYKSFHCKMMSPMSVVVMASLFTVTSTQFSCKEINAHILSMMYNIFIVTQSSLCSPLIYFAGIMVHLLLLYDRLILPVRAFCSIMGANAPKL